MKRILRAIMFFAGWVLSPFTWWNDAFINIPLGYLIANIFSFFTALPFCLLVIAAYCLTNVAGLVLMFFGGKSIIFSSENKKRRAILLALSLIIYSALMIYLDRQGKLRPISEYFRKNMRIVR